MMHLSPNVKLVISDVDETIADVYVDTDPALISLIENLIKRGVRIVFSSGSGLTRIENGVISKLKKDYRKYVLVAHCSSSEIWGYDDEGVRLSHPFYSSISGIITDAQAQKWRDVMGEMIKSFYLVKYPAMPIGVFKEKSNHDPLSIIYDDRTVQITLEVVNGYDLDSDTAYKLGVAMNDGKYDLRNEIIAWTTKRFAEENLPIQIHKGGVFAINFLITQSDKGGCIDIIKNDERILAHLGIKSDIFDDYRNIEVWGDKFSMKSGKNDWCISTALDPRTLSISFRKEDEAKFFPPGVNIRKWDGTKLLHEGVLEYLQNSQK